MPANANYPARSRSIALGKVMPGKSRDIGITEPLKGFRGPKAPSAPAGKAPKAGALKRR